MAVPWTVHIPQAMQQHGGGVRREEAPAKTTPAPDTRAGGSAAQPRADEAK
jgi:hypothetical protein